MDKNTVMIDLSQLEAVADIHELLRYKLGLPEYYGGNLDALHDTIHEMARDEARHGKALKGFLDRYFK